MNEGKRRSLTTSRRTALKIFGVAAAGSVLTRGAAAAEPIKIGLSAAFSGPNATAGQALQRGADLAIEEINSDGGVLGRPLALAIRDNEHKLDRGVAQTRELIEREGCAAILGSQGSFIGLAVIDTIHELKVPWFALAVGGVGIIENGRKPNYMFRVATNDREVAKFLVNYGQDKLGAKSFAILNEDTGWGVPAIDDLRAALKTRNREPASVDKMKVGDSDFTPQMLRAKNGGADTILTFSNAVVTPFRTSSSRVELNARASKRSFWRYSPGPFLSSSASADSTVTTTGLDRSRA